MILFIVAFLIGLAIIEQRPPVIPYWLKHLFDPQPGHPIPDPELRLSHGTEQTLTVADNELYDDLRS